MSYRISFKKLYLLLLESFRGPQTTKEKILAGIWSRHCCYQKYEFIVAVSISEHRKVVLGRLPKLFLSTKLKGVPKVWIARLDKMIWMLLIDSDKDKEKVIVNFCCREDCETVLKANNDYQRLNTTNLDHHPEGCRIFTNQSLCSYYCLLLINKQKITWRGQNICLVCLKQINEDKTSRN